MRRLPKQWAPEWSPSRIRDELKPLMYFWSQTRQGSSGQSIQAPRRVSDLPQDVLDFGKRVHAAIARLINVPPTKNGRVIHYQDVKKFRQSWFMLGKAAPHSSVNIDISLLLEGIYHFYEAQAARGVIFLGKEVPFTIQFPPDPDGYAPILKGRIDLIYRDGKDLMISDHKLPFEHLSSDQTSWDPQATYYLLPLVLWAFQDDNTAEHLGLPCSEKRDWDSYLETTIKLAGAEYSNISQPQLDDRQWKLRAIRTERTIDDVLFLKHFMKVVDLTKFYWQYTSQRINPGAQPTTPSLLRVGFPRAPTVSAFPKHKGRRKPQYRFQVNEANEFELSKLARPKTI